MRYNQLGNSDIQISEIGFGCMSLDMNANEANSKLIEKAIESGINYFDTADLYNFGANEVVLGNAIKKQRHQLIIATKVGNKWKKDKSGWSWDVSASYIHQAVNESLERLQTDYIDLYQIHGGTKEDNFEEVADTLETLVRQGKIRTYGISSIRPNVFLKFAKQSNIVSNLMQFSLLDTRPIPYLAELSGNQVSIIARGGFAQGLLLGKSPKEYLGHSIDEVNDIVQMMAELAKKYNTSAESIALSYLLNYHKISSAVVGIRTSEQLESIIQAQKELESLSIDFDKIQIPLLKYTDHLE